MKTVKSNKRDNFCANNALIKQQSERIKELREEVRALEKTVESYRSREREITQTLDFARKKGEEYVSSIRIKYALECERIRRFREKLEKYRNKDELIIAHENAFSELKKIQIDLEKTMADDLGCAINDYLTERNRLNDEPHLNYGAIVSDNESLLSDVDKISEEDLRELLEQI